MKEPVVIIGMGEMGTVFARAFLKSGYPVYPVTRSNDMAREAETIPSPAVVLVAVGENDLGGVLETLPEKWRPRVCLLQNELLPQDWQKHKLTEPTVISSWFEKKPGQDFKVLMPSPVYGPNARLIKAALSSLDIPVDLMTDESHLLQQLVTKNLYILTTNICGLETGGNVKQLWDDHTILMNRVFDDVLLIQQHLCATVFDRDPLMISLLDAFEGDPEHKCMGRSAPQRLQRALQISADAGIEVAELQRISRNTP